MDARKATAAVSAAGFMLIAGCGGGGGGGKMGGASLPNGGGSQSGLHNTTQPANSSRVGLKFTIPAHQTAWAESLKRQSLGTSRRAPTSITTRRGQVSVKHSPLFSRKPKFVSPGVIGGSISVFVYQGTSLALTDGPFSVGTTYGAYDFYCSPTNPEEVQCVNYSPVFAPYGTDTFFVAMYDSANHLLSITPGMPGSSFYAAAQTPYTITSAGYPSPISIYNYGVVAQMGIDATTSCIDPSLYPAYFAETALFDADGYEIIGPFANPVTVTTSGGLTFNSLIANGPVPSTYTIYNTNDFFYLFAASSGITGSISATSSAGSVSINGGTSSMNLYTVDRLALSASTSGLTVTGLVDSGPSTYNCGKLAMFDVSTGSKITGFSNPKGIGGDDYFPAAGILDDVSGAAYLDVVNLARGDFETLPFQAAAATYHQSISGAAPISAAVSPITVGNNMVYVLNSDGSVSGLNTMTGNVVSVASAGSVGGPSDIAVSWNTGSPGGDYVFATSNNSPDVFEIMTANTSPSPVTIDLSDGPSNSGQTLYSPVTYAVSAENLSGEQYVTFLAFDSGNGNSEDIITCLYSFCPIQIGTTVVGYSTNLGAGDASFAYPAGSLYLLAASGMNVATFIPNVPAQPSPGPFPAFTNPVTQIISSYDGLWNGVATGGLVQFFYNFSGTVAGSMSANKAVIISTYAFGQSFAQN